MNYQGKNQTEVFLDKEADGWFERNFKTQTKQDQDKDMALSFLLSLDLKDISVLEVGCADGWRLDRLSQAGCQECVGVDPSAKAVAMGQSRFPDVSLKVGTASNTNIDNKTFDIVVAGFCLYLCDRSELFKIAYEFDRLLNDGGMIVITDFISDIPYRNKYSHCEGLYSYKMDYSKLFCWNPIYSIIYQRNVDMKDLSISGENRDDQITLTVIKKKNKGSYPLEPYSV